MLDREVRCPGCLQWTRPMLPQPGGGLRPELAGQSRLNELNTATDEKKARRKRRRSIRPPAPTEPSDILEPTETVEPIEMAEIVEPIETLEPVEPQPMSNLWYVMTSKGNSGPFCRDKINEFAQAGKIDGTNKLKNAETGAIVRTRDIVDIFTKPATPQPEPEPIPEGKRQWYVHTSKGDAGPFPNTKIIELAQAGKITEKTMLRKGAEGEFIPAGKVQGLITKSSY